MLNYESIYTSFERIVGLRQTKDPHTPLIDQSLVTSESGLFANDLAMNWITNKNINLCIDDYASFEYPIWAVDSEFLKNERVVYDQKVYLALQNSIGVQPDTDIAQWRVLYDIPTLSTWLSEMKMATIKELVNATLEKNQEMNQSQVLSPDSIGVAVEGNIPFRSADDQNRFYGYTLRPCNRNDAQLQVRKIGIKVAEAQTITFYVFHYSQSEAIKTYTVEILPTDAGKFVWKDILDTEGNPCILDYLQNDKNAGGDFAFGVFRGAIAGDVQEMILNEFSETYNPKRNRLKGFFNLDFIQVKEPYLNGTSLFEVSQIEYDRESALFNLDLVAYADQSYQIIASKRLWARAIQLGMAVKILSEMFQSSQLNRISSEAQKEIGFLLHGNKAMEISGLKHRYFNACKNLVKQYEQAKTEGFENNVFPTFNFY